MQDLYEAHIIEHYKHPRNYGRIKDADVVVEERNASCGDGFTLSLKLKIENGELKITDTKFQGHGCAISTAAMSLVTDKIKKEKFSIDKIQRMRDVDVIKLLGIEVSPTRRKCALLPLRALKSALHESVKLKTKNDPFDRSFDSEGRALRLRLEELRASK